MSTPYCTWCVFLLPMLLITLATRPENTFCRGGVGEQEARDASGRVSVCWG